MAWDYMTATFAGGDELFTALYSKRVGTFGLEPFIEQTGEVVQFVGGYEAYRGGYRQKIPVDLYPFSNDNTGTHNYTDYTALMRVFRQRYVWLEDLTDPLGCLAIGSLPVELTPYSLSVSMDKEYANQKVRLELGFSEGLP